MEINPAMNDFPEPTPARNKFLALTEL
jgi:hypothetical protein